MGHAFHEIAVNVLVILILIKYINAAATVLQPLDTVYHSALRFITDDRFSTALYSVSESRLALSEVS